MNFFFVVENGGNTLHNRDRWLMKNVKLKKNIPTVKFFYAVEIIVKNRSGYASNDDYPC